MHQFLKWRGQMGLYLYDKLDYESTVDKTALFGEY